MPKSIHPSTCIGHVHLNVANLDRQLDFYQEGLGFVLHWRKGNHAGMGAGETDLLRLTEEPEFKRYTGTTGLYHFAILHPNRKELARAVARLFSKNVRNSPTDHIMTKTTYLDDPEGNGIELYAESPEDGTFQIEEGQFTARRADGSLSDGREPLDVEALFGLLNANDRLDLPAAPDTRVGHVHLHVRDVDEAVDFYHDILGFDVMGISKSFRVAFVSAGGYHHHIGLNTWQGEGASPPPPDALGMKYFNVELPDKTAYDEVLSRIEKAGVQGRELNDGFLVQDPSKNDVMLSYKSE